MTFNWDEVDRIRQWFDALEDTNTVYLVREDYVLAKKIYEKLEMRVPGSMGGGLEKINSRNKNPIPYFLCKHILRL